MRRSFLLLSSSLSSARGPFTHTFLVSLETLPSYSFHHVLQIGFLFCRQTHFPVYLLLQYTFCQYKMETWLLYSTYKQLALKFPACALWSNNYLCRSQIRSCFSYRKLHYETISKNTAHSIFSKKRECWKDSLVKTVKIWAHSPANS